MFRISTYALLTLMAALGGTSAAKDSRHLRAEGLLQEREGPPPDIHLGVAGTFAILSASGITDKYPSDITGNVGTSPITGAALLLECDEVTDGVIYTVDAAGPACKETSESMLTTAIENMVTAYDQAAGVSDPDHLNLGVGGGGELYCSEYLNLEVEGEQTCSIGGITLSPGVYKWTSSVHISEEITIEGDSDDKWIFQIAGTLKQSPDVKILLSNGAQAKNIVWQVADAVTLGTTSHFEGVILGKTGINLQTGASLNGRLLAQTAVTLQMNTIVQS